MTDSFSSHLKASAAQGQTTGQLWRGRLEQALNRALEAGAAALAQQMRYILAISQMTALQSEPQTRTTRPLPVGEARLQTLTAFSPALNKAQLKLLIREVQQIEDDYTRLRLLIQLAPRVPPQRKPLFVKNIWRQLDTLTDAAARVDILLQLAPIVATLDAAPATDSALVELIKLAQSIEDKDARLRSLNAIAPHLPQPMALRLQHRILDALDESNDDALRCTMLSMLSKHLMRGALMRALQCAEGIRDAAERARALTALAHNLPQELRPRLRSEALQAIQAIDAEDERAEALIAFAPHLEYAMEDEQFPEILQQALGIAIDINRRSLRARVLVALAPHLTSDLQGEALAAVHALENEHDRAMLLAELAPALPANMLVASLAVAHIMQEQDARAHALTVLARYAPPLAQEQTRLDALAAASSLPHHFERVTALMHLVDALPPNLREQAYETALEAAEQIENDNARARAINILGGRLPPPLLARIVDMAQAFEDPQLRLNALINIVPRLSSEQREDGYRELLKCVRALPYAYKQARSLINIVPLLPPPLLEEAKHIADNMRDPLDRVNIYIALSHHLPRRKRREVIAEAWQLIPTIDDGYDRASVLAAIAPLLPQELRQASGEIALEIIKAIHDDYDRASAIGLLAALLAEGGQMPKAALPDYQLLLEEILETALDIPDQSQRAAALASGVELYLAQKAKEPYQIWQRLAQRLKTLPLADVLLCFSALRPLITEIIGEEAMRDIVLVLGVR